MFIAVRYGTVKKFVKIADNVAFSDFDEAVKTTLEINEISGYSFNGFTIEEDILIDFLHQKALCMDFVLEASGNYH